MSEADGPAMAEVEPAPAPPEPLDPEAVAQPGSQSAEDTVHPHKPHPWHGWREFLKEYAIIFVGVLTALAAEQAVEALHWRHEVKEGREALHREMAADNGYFRDRITVGPCLDRQLDRDEAALDAAEAHKPIQHNPQVTGPGRLMVTSQWGLEQASQVLTHFPREELSKLALWYEQIGPMREWDASEQDAWSRLSALKSAASIGPSELAALRQELQRARNLKTLMTANSRRELARAKDLGVGADPPAQDYIRFMCKP